MCFSFRLDCGFNYFDAVELRVYWLKAPDKYIVVELNSGLLCGCGVWCRRLNETKSKQACQKCDYEYRHIAGENAIHS